MRRSSLMSGELCRGGRRGPPRPGAWAGERRAVRGAVCRAVRWVATHPSRRALRRAHSPEACSRVCGCRLVATGESRRTWRPKRLPSTRTLVAQGRDRSWRRRHRGRRDRPGRPPAFEDAAAAASAAASRRPATPPSTTKDEKEESKDKRKDEDKDKNKKDGTERGEQGSRGGRGEAPAVADAGGGSRRSGRACRCQCQRS